MQLACSVSLDGEGFERGAGGVLASGVELLGEAVRDVEDHLHGERLAGLLKCGVDVLGCERGVFCSLYLSEREVNE